MFDIGFLEIMVIMIVGLIVIGPERMPEVARKIGKYVGKVKSFIHSVKHDGEFHNSINEIKESLDFESSKLGLQELKDDLKQTASEIESIEYDKMERPFGEDSNNSKTGNGQYRKAPEQPNVLHNKNSKVSDVNLTSKNKSDEDKLNKSKPNKSKPNEKKLAKNISSKFETELKTNQKLNE